MFRKPNFVHTLNFLNLSSYLWSTRVNICSLLLDPDLCKLYPLITVNLVEIGSVSIELDKPSNDQGKESHKRTGDTDVGSNGVRVEVCGDTVLN